MKQEEDPLVMSYVGERESAIGRRLKGFAICNPESRWFRLIMLIGACALTFGSYYCYDNPAAMGKEYIDQYYNIESGYELLYSVYSFPNIILPFFGGALIDRWLGVRLGGILFGVLVCLGQILFAFSSHFQSSVGFYIALAGRVLFGFGGESLSVAQSAYIAKWFPNSELATAFGITLAFARLGSAVNLVLTPQIASYTSFSVALWFGAILCLLSVITAVILAVMDTVGAKVARPPGQTGNTEEPIRILDIFRFKYIYWYLVIVVMFYYVAVFVYIQTSNNMLQQYHPELSSLHLEILTSIPYLTAAVCAPLFGLIVDRTGFLLYWLALACIVNSFCQVILWALQVVPPSIPILGIGLSYSLVAASLWPCFPSIVKDSEIGTAYGGAFSVQNFGQVIFPLGVGYVTNGANYRTAQLTYFWMALISFVVTVCMIWADRVSHFNLNVSAKRRAEIQVEKSLSPVDTLTDSEKADSHYIN